MRIYDKHNKEALTNILIMLTSKELRELIDSLDSLEEHMEHVHIDDDDYKRQITIGIYSNENLQKFSPEIVKLIESN